jgi:hypothetical protein
MGVKARFNHKQQMFKNKKIIIKQQTFQVPGTFESMYAAQAWIKSLGYDYGSNSGGSTPTAVMKGDYQSYDLPLKMKNFTPAQVKMIHGRMIGDMRNGPVKVQIYE